jgi:hypothetical protein
MLLLGVVANFLEHSTVLSAEALKYQRDYPDTIRSGIDLAFGVARLLVYVGAALGAIGALLTFLRPSWAFTSIALSAPCIAFATYLNSPQSNYPSVEPIGPLVLWCFASAAWGASVALAWMRRTNHRRDLTDIAKT